MPAHPPISRAASIQPLAVVRLRQDLLSGTVIEELDENTVLVEFADDSGKAIEVVPVSKALLTQVVRPIPNPLLDVTKVEALPGFVLRLTFENGEVRRFSMSKLLARQATVFTPLRRVKMFQQVFIAEGTVCWPDGADIDPEFLYEESVPECHDSYDEPLGYPVDDAWENMPEVGLERWPYGEREDGG